MGGNGGGGDNISGAKKRERKGKLEITKTYLCCLWICLVSLRWYSAEAQAAPQDKAHSWHRQIQTLGQSARGKRQGRSSESKAVKLMGCEARVGRRAGKIESCPLPARVFYFGLKMVLPAHDLLLGQIIIVKCQLPSFYYL